MEIPEDLARILAGRTAQQLELGRSGADVWRYSGTSGPALYLKRASGLAVAELEGEEARLDWLHSLVSVPAVLGSSAVGDDYYLLLEGLKGYPASDERWRNEAPSVVDVIADALRWLHDVSVLGCPFDARLASRIESARHRVAAGLVDESDFDEPRLGRSARELFREVERSAPTAEDLVLAHGDLSLPNVILDRDAAGTVVFSGFVDCGRAGLSDRYQDLALAARGIAGNFDERWVVPFFQRYGIADPDPDKIAFYQLLDEFF